MPCLFQVYNHVFTLHILISSSKIDHDHMRVMLSKQKPIFCHAYIMYSAISWFHVLKLPNDIQIADR
jgi:hypothetical protein